MLLINNDSESPAISWSLAGDTAHCFFVDAIGNVFFVVPAVNAVTSGCLSEKATLIAHAMCYVVEMAKLAAGWSRLPCLIALGFSFDGADSALSRRRLRLRRAALRRRSSVTFGPPTQENKGPLTTVATSLRYLRAQQGSRKLAVLQLFCGFHSSQSPAFMLLLRSVAPICFQLQAVHREVTPTKNV
jgi:hypothetical protein